ncbi:hypothetical protein ACWFRJ_02555 [Streptomyces sp. NPDC055239]
MRPEVHPADAPQRGTVARWSTASDAAGADAEERVVVRAERTSEPETGTDTDTEDDEHT